MNAPDRFELFLLAEGEKKITEVPFTRMSNCSDFILKKEDHTLGNLVSEHLKQQPHILMAGYKVAHPNVPELFIRVQTDGSMTPREAFVHACEKLVTFLSQLSREFTREYELRRIVNTDQQANANGKANGGY